MTSVERYHTLADGVYGASRGWAAAREGRGPCHVNDGVEVSWVERGVLSFDVGRQSVTAAAGSCLVLPPGIENTPRGRVVLVHQVVLPAALIDEAAEAMGGRGPRAPGTRSPGEAASLAMRLVAAQLTAGATADDPALGAALELLAMELVRPTGSEVRPEPVAPPIRRALDLVAARFDAPLGVADLARAAGMSRFAFSRAFRAAVGESPYQHLLRVRLERAAERLRATGDPVSEVALGCGFHDPGRFARQFRARFGLSPGQLRRHESPDR